MTCLFFPPTPDVMFCTIWREFPARMPNDASDESSDIMPTTSVSFSMSFSMSTWKWSSHRYRNVGTGFGGSIS
jgi:hypothetical protein